MAINKVVFGNEVQMDLTEDTVTEDKVLEGETFHDRSGNRRTGNLVIPVQDVEVNGESVVNSEKVAKIDIPTTDIQTAVDEFETYNGGLLSECKVSLTPNQDLHGYDHPWIGGAGKNLLDTASFTRISGTSSGITVTVDKEHECYTMVGTPTDENINVWFLGDYVAGRNVLTLPSGTYYVKGVNLYDLDGSGLVVTGGRDGQFFTLTEEHSFDGIRAVNVPLGEAINEVHYPFICKVDDTSVVPSYEPYKNICPISGHTQVKVGDDGKNRLSSQNLVLTGSGNYFKTAEDTTLDVGTWTLSLYNDSTQNMRMLINKIINGSEVTIANVPITSKNRGSYTVTLTERTTMRISGRFDDSSTITDLSVFKELQIEKGSTATPYVPYNGYQITVNLGGTYYSGILDVVSGVFVATHAEIDLGTVTWVRITNNVFRASNSGMEVVADNVTADLTCEIYKKGNYTGLGNGEIAIRAGSQIWVRDSTVDDVTTFTNQVNGKKLVYPLATPTPIQLSPTMVKALVGENHLSAPLDGQEITESKYRELFTWDEVESYVNAHSGGGGGVDYSTTEVDTGIKWTDGKPIYMRTFTNVGLPQNAYSATLDLGVEADTIVKIEANDSANAGNATIIFEGVYAKINKTAGSNTILNPTNQLANLTGATLTVYYTKATD